VAFRGAELNDDVLAFDVTGLLQALPECRHEVRGVGKGHTTQESDRRHCRLLRMRRERPADCRNDKTSD
jgi:hypothetical protein